jgi:hypothetical protein
VKDMRDSSLESGIDVSYVKFNYLEKEGRDILHKTPYLLRKI